MVYVPLISLNSDQKMSMMIKSPLLITFTNISYKTSTICGEKFLVLPKNLFSDLKLYHLKLRTILNQSSIDYLFVQNDGEKMTHGAIGSVLTASFDKACGFNKQEYPRVSPTKITCKKLTIVNVPVLSHI